MAPRPSSAPSRRGWPSTSRPRSAKRARRTEHEWLRRFLAEFSDHPSIEILGDLTVERLGIVSLIFHGLHHNFAVALLNDYFGLQVRGGCMCAGPYGHDLLGIDDQVSRGIRRELEHGHCGLKPGWVRVSFSPVTREQEFQTLLEGVRFVARQGRRHLDDYQLDDATGEWKLRSVVA